MPLPTHVSPRLRARFDRSPIQLLRNGATIIECLPHHSCTSMIILGCSLKKLHILLILLYYFTPFLGRLHSLWLLVMAVISPLLPRSTSRLKSEHVLHLKSFAVAWRSLGFFLGRSVGEVKKAFWVHFFEIWTNNFFVQKCDFNFLNFPKTFWKHENNIE